MAKRYFIEVCYKGTHFNGFQIQDNAPTIQGCIQQALHTILKEKIILTGSSRTDSGVHALQNFFHFDFHFSIDENKITHSLNAMLPQDIAVKKIFSVEENLHARFSAISREYKYQIVRNKNPFYFDTAYLFHKDWNLALLNQAAKELFNYKDFSSFSKLHTQVYTNDCTILQSEWRQENDMLIYHVKANRFLRGMVRALVATMLKVGCGKISMDEFVKIILSKDCTKAYFDAPAKGLFLTQVQY